MMINDYKVINGDVSKRYKLISMGDNRYKDKNGIIFSLRKLDLGNKVIGQEIKVSVFVSVDDITNNFKKTRDYEILLLVLCCLFLIPSTFIFSIYIIDHFLNSSVTPLDKYIMMKPFCMNKKNMVNWLCLLGN